MEMSKDEANVSELLAQLESIQIAFTHSSNNADAFFLITNGMIIYCKYCRLFLPFFFVSGT